MSFLNRSTLTLGLILAVGGLVGAEAAAVARQFAPAPGFSPRPRYNINISGAQALDSIQDLTGDGIRELIVGIPTSSQVQVRSGRNGNLLGTMNGPTFSDFGYDVASIGDVDVDGLEDILIGAPAGGTMGLAFVYRSSNFSFIASWGPSTVGQAGSLYGFSVARGDQINGTGPEEVFVSGPTYSPFGAPNAGYFGLVETIDLAAAPAVVSTITGMANWEEFGDAVTSVDDRDGDGVRELMVGATRFFGPSGTSPGTIPGLARVYSGATLTFPAGLEVLLNTYIGTGGATDTFGFSVGDALDLDLDGTGDALLGAPHFFQLGPPYVMVNRSNLGNSTVPAPGATCLNFGHAVSSIGGSINGDVIPEFIVGAPVRFGGCGSNGRAYVFNGRNDNLLFTLSVAGGSATFGWDVTELDTVGNRVLYAVSDPGTGRVHVY